VWNNARFVNLIANALTTVALTALVLGGLVWLAHRPVFTLSGISIQPVPGETLQHVSETGVRSVIAGRLQGNFFTTDLQTVREVFETLPWVRQAMVRRVWPDGLEVTLREFEPLGLWNDNQLLDMHGVPFTANQAEAESADGGPLPQLSGPEGSGKLVKQRLEELTEWVAPLGLVPVRLSLSARHAWRAELDNGLILDMGRDPSTGISQSGSPEDGDENTVPVQLRVQRFVESLAAVEQRVGRPVIYADLRYPNGFALRLGEAPKMNKTSTPATKP